MLLRSLPCPWYPQGLAEASLRHALSGTDQQGADAQARLSVMLSLQPLAWFIAGLGVVLLVLGIVLKPSVPPLQGEKQSP